MIETDGVDGTGDARDTEVTTTERGWPGHYICAGRCLFRRNTLVEGPGGRVVVSTVGHGRDPNGSWHIVGAGLNEYRYYETMVFDAQDEGPYVDANVSCQRDDYKGRCGIYAKTPDDLPEDVDNQANKMHEDVVAFYAELLGR